MKKNFLILLSLFYISNLNAQSIRFEKSLKLAQEKSAANEKPLFVLISVPSSNLSGSASSGLEDPQVVKFFNSHFINLKTTLRDSTVSKMLKPYTLNVFPAYLFFDKFGNIIYRAEKKWGNSQAYLRLGKEVLKTAAALKNHSYYIEQHRKGALSQQELREYILLRKKLGINNNADLADEYVNTLAVKDLNNYQTVLFILSSGPYYEGKAYRLAYSNKQLVDSIYKTEPLPIRLQINNLIIRNSTLKAIGTKNTAFAQSIARFAQSTWRSNYSAGSQAYQVWMLSYYKAINDTANFLSSSRYFDQYYHLSADSIRKLNLKAKEYNINKATAIRLESLRDTVINASIRMNDSEQFSISQGRQTVSSILNNAAWDIYKTGTKTSEHLERAIRWARKAISIEAIPAYYDTLAHLFYSYGLYEEAELYQKKAVNLTSKPPYTALKEKMKEELKKMQKLKL